MTSTREVTKERENVREGQRCSDCDALLPEGRRRQICPNCGSRDLVPTPIETCVWCSEEFALADADLHYNDTCPFRE